MTDSGSLIRRDFIEYGPHQVAYLSDLAVRYYTDLFAGYGQLKPGETLPTERAAFDEKLWAILDAQAAEIEEDFRRAPPTGRERAAGVWHSGLVRMALADDTGQKRGEVLPFRKPEP